MHVRIEELNVELTQEESACIFHALYGSMESGIKQAITQGRDYHIEDDGVPREHLRLALAFAVFANRCPMETLEKLRALQSETKARRK